MAIDMTFVDYVTPVPADWLNNVNTFVNTSPTPPTADLYLNVLDLGVKNDGTTDNTTAYVTAVNTALSANKALFFPAGTYLGQLPVVTTGDMRYVGEGVDKTILKRTSTGTGPVISFGGNFTFMIEQMTIDGNKAANTNSSVNINVASGTTSFAMQFCRVQNAKTYSGINIGDNLANRQGVGNHRIQFCEVLDNDGGGVLIQQEQYISVCDNEVHDNGGTGIAASYYVFPPVAAAQTYMWVCRNKVYNHLSAGGAGIFLTGFITGGSATWPEYGPSTNANQYVVCNENVVVSNKGYGLVCQANYFSVCSNICNFNGDYSSPNGPAYAGILVNGAFGTVNNNTVYGNSGYGVDMGGSSYYTFSGNTVMQNATSAGGGFIGLNLGASQYCSVTGNTVGLNGPLSGGHQIELPGFDGGVTAFPGLTIGVSIKDNLIVNGFGSTQIGIFVYGNPTSCSIVGNHIQGGTDNDAIIIRTNAGLYVTGNTCDATSIAGPVITSASATIVPDWAEVVFVNGGTGITDLLTYSQANLLETVCEAIVTNGGTGYDPNPANAPTVSISGGGGSGATGVAAVDGSGHVISVKITAAGSGYTTTPTITIVPPSSGTTATATAVVNCNNSAGRRITMEFSANTLITAGNHIVMPTSSFTAGINTCVDWLGNANGLYMLRSRSS